VAVDPDRELIRRYLAGDADAFTTLVHRHEVTVYRLCLRTLGDPEDAADATQEALLLVARNLDRFRGDARFSTWLHRIAMNVCFDHLRAAKRRPVLHRLPDDGPDPEPGPPVADHADAVVGTRDITIALRSIPEDFRIALVLADIQDLPYEEIARILDVPIGTVKSRVHRGRVALARVMGLAGPEPEPLPRPSEETT
jgi:RNA polymerase sigma-70 factor, ECF subfamily